MAAFVLAAPALACIGVGTAACTTTVVRASNPTRPLDERRAIEVIRSAIRAEGARPTAGRDVAISSGAVLRVDVGVEGREYGVAYITRAEAERLGSGIPPRNLKDERLRLARGGPNGEVRIVLLYEENYAYDDLAGDSHEQTAIACEQELARDVRDFITYARTQRFR